MTTKWISDWLNLKPIFYNERTLEISYNINDIINYSNIEFHPEGLLNYLEFGYSVFGQTPLKNIKFLKPCSELSVVNGKFLIKKLKDPADQLFHNKKSSAKEVINLIKNDINNWASHQEKEIILPLSGGLDSRMMAILTKDKKKLSCFTYGGSSQQKKSYEVIRAKNLCKKYKIKWSRIDLNNYLEYMKEWSELFGISTHAHGMYQMEFYEKIKKKGYQQNGLLSGIIADGFAGSIPKLKINSYKDISKLGHSHGLNANPKYCKLKTNYKLKKIFYEENKKKLESWSYQNISTLRLKMILLSFLFKIPEHYGFNPYSPFIDEKIAIKMLNLPIFDRQNRKWQKSFVKKSGENTNKNPFIMSFRNNLGYQVLKNFKFEKLNHNLLTDLFEVEYIKNINKELSSYSIKDKILEFIFSTPRIGRLITSKLKLDNKKLSAYNAYLTIKPIQDILIKSKKIKTKQNGKDI